MPSLHIELNGDGILTGFPPEKIINVQGPITITTLPNGMDSGRPSVGIIADLPSGEKVFMQTSVRLFLLAAMAMRAKYPELVEEMG